MSRTYRKSEEWYWDAMGVHFDDVAFDMYQDYEKIEYGDTSSFNFPSWGWARKCKYIKNGRDHKRWDKPPRWFKQMKRQLERARVKHAIRNGRFENIPRFRKSDQWDWT